MVRKVTKNNYRQFYKEYYGIEFGREFEVHHIDKNRDNNNIENLVLLPAKAHNYYHKIDSLVEMCNPRIYGGLFDVLTNATFSEFIQKYELNKIIKVLSDWYNFKDSIDFDRSQNSLGNKGCYNQLSSIYQLYIDTYNEQL